MNFFKNLFSKNKYVGEVVYLVERYRLSKDEASDGVPTIYYDIYLNDSDVKVGSIELRLTIEGFMYYYGHIGYNIMKVHRGNHYAYYACKVIFDIAKKEFGLNELIITCSPENIASYKTLVKLEGEIIDLVDVPSDHTLYMMGETKKYIFKYTI